LSYIKNIKVGQLISKLNSASEITPLDSILYVKGQEGRSNDINNTKFRLADTISHFLASEITVMVFKYFKSKYVKTQKKKVEQYQKYQK
jgi:hypothetical protein